jgi:hypothetical protein
MHFPETELRLRKVHCLRKMHREHTGLKNCRSVSILTATDLFISLSFSKNATPNVIHIICWTCESRTTPSGSLGLEKQKGESCIGKEGSELPLQLSRLPEGVVLD